MQDMDRLADLNADMLPFAKLLGMTFTGAEPDRVTAELVVRDDLCTRPAVLHGGAITAFADTLGAAGTILNLPQGAWTSTVESKTNFVGPPLGSRVMGEATPIHRGKTTMVWQTPVTTEPGRLVPLLTQIQLVQAARKA
jgi:1,4-dihydroxy-2-naphthoyl-CoA hydrolase